MSEFDPTALERPFLAVPAPDHTDAARAAPSQRSWFDLPDGALGVFFLVLLAALSGGLIAVYWPWMQGSSETATATNDRLQTLETRMDEIAAGHASKAVASAFANQSRDLAALKSRLDADEARLTEMEKSSGAIDSVEAPSRAGHDKHAVEITQLSGRVAALEKSMSPYDLARELDSYALKSEAAPLGSQAGKPEGADMTNIMRHAAAVLALADLIRATGSAEPFTTELDQLKDLAPQSPALADLAQYAGQGVPTRTMLADQLSRDIPSIMAAESAVAGATWSESLATKFQNIISPSRAADPTANDTDSRLTRAESALKIGDLESAVHEVGALQMGAHVASEAWLRAAEQRLAVDRDTHALSTQLVASLATPNAPTK
jgi:hypothetical protein